VESFDELVSHYYDRVFRAALFMCGDRQAAEDLVQESFLAAGQSLDRFEGRSSPYTWLYGILLNKFRKWLRERGEMRYLQEMADEGHADAAADRLEAVVQEPMQEIEKQEMADLVQEAILELPPYHRSVLVLRYLEAFSYEEIAESLGCSIGTVKSRIHYALKKLARRLRLARGFEED